MHFEVGDMVMLSTKYLKSIRPKKKLDKSYEGPHKVVKVINQNAYQLELPPKVKLFPTFHISLLEPYQGSDRFPQDPVPSWDTLELDDNKDDVYKVKEIQGQRYNKEGYWEYKVLWKGYPESDSTWEPVEHLTKTTLRAFLAKIKKSSQSQGHKAISQVVRSGAQKPQMASMELKQGRGRPSKKGRG